MSANRNDRGSISTFYSLCLLLLCCLATCTKGETVFSIRDQSWSEVASFDDQGNLYLNGGLTTNTTPESTEYDEFRVQGYGQDVAIVSMSTGDMTISGSLNENQTDLSGANHFVIKDNYGSPVAYIDTSGNLFLKGAVSIYVNICADIDVDSDRNGTVDGTVDEDNLEETQAAVILPNCDDDGGDGVPDNWPGEYNIHYMHRQSGVGSKSGDWDLDDLYESFENPNSVVDADPDKDDLGCIWIHRIPSIPSGSEIEIKVQKASSGNYWTSVSNKDMVRIFIPTDDVSDPGNTQIQSGDHAAIGPELKDSVVFKENPDPSNDSEQDIGLIQGTGLFKLGIEGIEFAGEITITMEMRIGGTIIGSDYVKLMVSTYELCHHGMDANRAYVTDEGLWNSDFRTKLSAHFGSNLVQMQSGDVWQQDGYEIGRTSDGFNSMTIFLTSPRAYRSNDLAIFVHRECLDSGVGVCWRLEGIGDNYGTQDSFGNLECRPSTNEMVYGDLMHSDIVSFFETQDMNPRLPLDTSWLSVQHVDEVISFTPTGKTVVADPEIAWGLLVWAVSNGSQQAYINNYNLNAYDTLTDTSTGSVLDDTFSSVIPNINAMRTSLGLVSPETDPIKNNNPSLDSELERAGVFWANGVPSTRQFQVVFDLGDSFYYSLYYRDSSSGSWVKDTDAFGIYWDQQGSLIGERQGDAYVTVNGEVIFKQANCFILWDFWQNRGNINPGDTYSFQANTSSSTIEIPVIFHNGDALTINNVNSVVDESTIITGMTHESNTGNVFHDYIQAAYQLAGYTDVVFADSHMYWEWEGDLHCGSNTQR